MSKAFLAATVALGALLATPALAQDGECKTLNFYNWDTYIGPDTIKNFEAETGIKVTYDLYADSEELFAKLKNGNPGYDLIVPSNDYTEKMIASDMLVELDKSKIPNIKNIEERFMDVSFDPGRKYSLPYMWGTIGLGYRKSAVEGEPESWKDVLQSDKYAGRYAALSDGTSMMQLALVALGKDVNDLSDENIAAAEQLWKDAKKNVVAFAPDNGQDLLQQGEADLVIEYNGDIAQVQEEDDDIAYTVPAEGTLLWEDTLAIPKGAPCEAAAYKMIDFILSQKEGAAIAAEIAYATPNKAAKEIMDKEYLENPVIFPSEEALAKAQTPKAPSVEDAAKLDAAWTRVKAAN